MQSATTFKERLLDLKWRFVRTMPDRIAAIASTLAGCMDGGREMTDRLERQFHALAGTAGTYDLDAVAAAAFDGEEACAELNQSPLDSESFTYLTFLVNQLRGALDASVPVHWTPSTVFTAAHAPVSRQTGVSAA
jgi:HPt (histidine-containing phosphotransfer) domain-containing protein